MSACFARTTRESSPSNHRRLANRMKIKDSERRSFEPVYNRPVKFPWPELAAFAYGSFLEDGPGAVLLAKEWRWITDPEIFSNANITEKIELRLLLSNYNPNRDVILISAEGDLLTHVDKVSATAVFTPPNMYHQSKVAEWPYVLRDWYGEKTEDDRTYEREEQRQYRSFRASERKRTR